jgi:hypothetical protein
VKNNPKNKLLRKDLDPKVKKRIRIRIRSHHTLDILQAILEPQYLLYLTERIKNLGVLRFSTLDWVGRRKKFLNHLKNLKTFLILNGIQRKTPQMILILFIRIDWNQIFYLEEAIKQDSILLSRERTL